MANPIRCVLVGLGAMGKNHLRSLRAHPLFDLVAVVEPEPMPELEAELKTAGCIMVRSLQELAALDYEAAVIATPTETHTSVATSFLKQKKHILLEKPTASTPAEAQALATAAKDNGCHLAVAFIERGNGGLRHLKGLLAEGTIGKPLWVQGHRAGPYPPRIRPGNDIILDMGSHELDCIEYLFGHLQLKQARQRCVRSPGIADLASAWLEGDDGLKVEVHVNWFSPGRQRLLRVTGERAVLELDYRLQSLTLDGKPLQTATITDGLQVQLDQFYAALRNQPHSLCINAEVVRNVELAAAWVAAARAAK